MKTSELIARLQDLSKNGDWDVKIETRSSGYDIDSVYGRRLGDGIPDQIFLILMHNDRKPRAQRSPTTEPSAFDSTTLP
jgi:hypothetical protein